MAEFPRVSPGDDVSALLTNSRWLNAITAGLNPAASPLPAAAAAGLVPYLAVAVKNASGADLDADFPIVRLGDPVFDADDDPKVVRRRIAFDVHDPDGETGGGFAVLRGPLKNNALRADWALLVGLTWCKVDVTDADHTHATAADGDPELLASGSGGARILWKPSGTGEKWALILLGLPGGARLQFAEAVGDITAAAAWATPGTGTVQFKKADGTNDGAAVGAIHWFPTTFVDGSVLVLNRDVDPPQIISGSCEAMP